MTRRRSDDSRRTYPWTDEQVATLKRLWLTDGLSASQIAKAMGGGLTRSAVIGKVFRLQLPKRSKDNAALQGKVNGRRAATQRAKSFARRLAAPPPPRPPAVAPTPVPLIPIQHDPVTILTMSRSHCRWPLSGQGADMLFCGAPRAGEHWCSRHKPIGVRAEAKALKKLPDASAARRGDKTTGLGLRMWAVA